MTTITIDRAVVEQALEALRAMNPYPASKEDQRASALAALLAALAQQAEPVQEQRDELRRALEIIAVGDATNPQAQAAEELIALGYWRDIPEARAAIKAVEEGK